MSIAAIVLSHFSISILPDNSNAKTVYISHSNKTTHDINYINCNNCLNFKHFNTLFKLLLAKNV